MTEQEIRQIVAGNLHRINTGGTRCVIFYDVSDGVPSNYKDPEFVYLQKGWENDHAAKLIACAAYNRKIPVICEEGKFEIDKTWLHYEWPGVKTIPVKKFDRERTPRTVLIESFNGVLKSYKKENDDEV